MPDTDTVRDAIDHAFTHIRAFFDGDTGPDPCAYCDANPESKPVALADTFPGPVPDIDADTFALIYADPEREPHP